MGVVSRLKWLGLTTFYGHVRVSALACWRVVLTTMVHSYGASSGAHASNETAHASLTKANRGLWSICKMK